MSHNTESRKEWLNSLKVGTRVTVKTQIRTYDGAIEAIKKDKIWVLFEMGNKTYSTVWVNPETGNNTATRVTINPYNWRL